MAQQRYLYNAALAERKNAWEQGKHRIKRFDQFASLNGLTETNPPLAQYGITVARGTLTRLDLAFGGFFRRCREAKPGVEVGYPRFKGPHRWDSVAYPDTSGWKIDPATRRLHLQGIGHIKVRLHRDLPGRPKTCTVKRRGTRWEVTVFCDRVPAKPLEPTGRQVGIDLGVAAILTTSDGEHLANPRFTRNAEEKLARSQRDLDRKVKYSKRRKRAVARVATHHRKVANCRKDLAHQTSRRLVDSFDLIVHEDLLVASMVRRPSPRPNSEGGFDPNGAAAKGGLNKSIHDAGWGQLLGSAPMPMRTRPSTSSGPGWPYAYSVKLDSV